ncbi:MAG: type II toxin-antitoxin system HicB family antitoxin [Dehalococcoidia bacterium]
MARLGALAFRLPSPSHVPDAARRLLYQAFNDIREAYAERSEVMPPDVPPALTKSSTQGGATLASYRVEIRPDDGAFVASVPDLPGCRAVGGTAEEAWLELDSVFEMFASVLTEDGHPLPHTHREALPVAR